MNDKLIQRRRMRDLNLGTQCDTLRRVRRQCEFCQQLTKQPCTRKRLARVCRNNTGNDHVER